MRHWRLTFALFFVAISILVSVPQLRHVPVAAFQSAALVGRFEAMWSPFRLKFQRLASVPGSGPDAEEITGIFVGEFAAKLSPLLLQTDCETVALAHPDDAGFWFGYAEVAREAEGSTRYGPPAKTTATQAYERAAAMSANPVPVRFRYATLLLDKAGNISRAEEYGGTAPPKDLLGPRTAEQAANLRAAQNILTALRQQDPDNAGCDYLLVWTFLQEHRDADALALARQAVSKPARRAYSADAVTARLRLGDALPAPEAITHIFPETDLKSSARARYVARVMSYLGDRFHEAGDHADAIPCYEAIVHMGHLMRSDARSSMELMNSFAVTSIPSYAFWSPADRQAADAIAGRKARNEYIQGVRRRGFAAYLREHGRSDVASLYERDVAANDVFSQIAVDSARRELNGNLDAILGPAIGVEMAVWAETLLFAGLTGVVSLIWLIGLAFGRPAARANAAFVEWLLAVAAVALPPAVTGVLLDRCAGPHSVWSTRTPWAIPLSCLAGLLAWLAVVSLMSRARGRAQRSAPGSREVGYLARMATLAPPTLAALVLASVILLWPISGAGTRQFGMSRAVATQGEVKYWHIDESNRDLAVQAAPRSEGVPK